MVQVLEAPWNGIILDGGWPDVSAPTTTSNPFYFFHQRNIKRVRVYLNPRVVMPVGSTTIPGGVQTKLTAIADAARATVSGTALECEIEWALQGCTEPTSATANRRPWLSWLSNFWEKVDDLLGAHDATWGYALMSQPRVLDLWPANSDPHADMATWADQTWSPTEDPRTNMAAWLESITFATVEHLRTAGATTKIIVPVAYTLYGANATRDAHPNGPWIDDADVWYEATVTPLGTDGYAVTKPYAAYNTDAAGVDVAYRDTWYESAYFVEESGAVSVLDPLDLNAPNQLDLAPENPPGALALPPDSLTVEALNGGGRISWAAPSFFGDGEYLGYQVAIFIPGSFAKMHLIDGLTVDIGPLVNGTAYDVEVTTLTTEGASAPAYAQLVPDAGAPSPENGWYVPPTEGGTPPTVFPQPSVFAFPEARNFRPSNWLKTPEEVEEGL